MINFRSILPIYKNRSSMTLLRKKLYTKVVHTNIILNINIANRCIHYSSDNYGKMFLELENNYGHNVMKMYGYGGNLFSEYNMRSVKLLNDADFNILCSLEYDNKPPQEIFKVFEELSHYAKKNNVCISNEMLDNFIDSLTDTLKYFSDYELEQIFLLLKLWPVPESVRTRNYIEVWAALDDVCLQRIPSWNYDKMLMYCDYMNMINVFKKSDFTMKCMKKIVSKAKQLNSKQLVQTLFYIGLRRCAPEGMHDMELRLQECIDSISVDELAVCSMGFFKSKTPIRSIDLVFNIIEKVIENSKTIKDISLASLLKIIRYSIQYSDSNLVDRLLDALEPEIPRLSMLACVHIGLICSATNTLHKKCLTKISCKYIDNIDQVRLKDLERLTLTLCTLCFDPPTSQPFYEIVLNELRSSKRSIEIEKYPRSYICCLSFLTLRKIIAPDLINTILDKKFLENAFGKYSFCYSRDVLILDKITDIYCKNYDGNRLSSKATKLLTKKYIDYVPTEEYKGALNKTEKIMLEIMKILRKLRGGHDYVCGYHVLPHFQRGDILFCNNQQDDPVPISEYFTSHDIGSVIKAPNNNKWFCLIIVGKNGTMKFTKEPTGIFEAKYDQLKTLGYIPIMVLWNDWSQLICENEKVKFLTDLIVNEGNKII